MPIVEALAAGAASAVILLAVGWVVHRIFVVEPKLRRAQLDANLSALKMSGQDRNRPMDISR